MTEKLQKTLADKGFGSRRQMERWIAAGRVTVNGQVAGVGTRVADTDDIVVDGHRVAKASGASCRVIALNKRAGVIVSRRDPEGRSTVFEDLPGLRTGRWISVGRLDLQTTGLLLFTNDGALAHRLSHPSTGIDREYAVRVAGLLDDDALARLRSGVDVGGRTEAFSDIRYYDGSGTNHWYHVVLMEGRNREVRDLFASQGVTVNRLKRVRYGPVILPAWLPRGAWEEMGAADVAKLRAIIGLAPDQPSRRKQPSRSMLIPYPSLA
ncbi:MAG: pseudouridine synthase [Gammaproteobacteria bacterium]|nr:pseudouridine synthase [Gammaproteobacteria bacterium]MXY57736.1 pseudouridine synthase [Gammaproteobacteria bacterium]MYF31334.1 pseudouridine synthase [Gammaproteobacteria bacterium]MYK45773.1 pseudouridine synthase [Gammaproteobacteria bacterium]